MATSRSARHLLPYLTIGVGYGAAAQFLFYGQIVGHGLGRWPFLWAYLQVAVLDRFIGVHTSLSTGVAWAVGYLVVSVVLWMISEVLRTTRQEHLWRRAFVAWLIAQIVFAGVGCGLFAAGIVEME